MGQGSGASRHGGARRPGGDDRRLAVQYAAVNALARGESAGSAAGELLRTLCEVTGWEGAQLWVASAGGDRLSRAGSWRSPALDARLWMRLGRASSVVRGRGLVGRVWEAGGSRWLEHPGADPRYRPVAGGQRVEVAAAAAAEHGGLLLGVLELVSIVPHPNDPALLRGLSDAGRLIGRQLGFDRAREAGLRSEARLAAILDSALDAVVVIAADGRVVEFNRAAEETFGHLRADAVGRSLAGLLIPRGLRAAHRRALALAARGEGGGLLGKRIETTALRAGGGEFPVELTITRVDAPGPAMFAGTIRDLSERRRAERELRLRDRALAATGDGVVITDATRAGTPIVYANAAFERISGHPATTLAGRSPRLLEGPRTDRRASDRLRAALAAEQECSITVLHYRRNGETFWDDVSIAPVRDEVGRLTGWIETHRDVSERFEAQRQIAHLAYHDAMTGLPNRLMFQQQLDLAIARARRRGGSVAVMFLDLDDFKLVNDSHGHAAGDRLLYELGRRLRAVTRATDLVARQGGDEFLVLLSDLEGAPAGPDAPDAVCETVARKIREAAGRPVLLDGVEVSLGVSIGVAVYPAAAESREELMRQADLAMYRAKVTGRGGLRHVYAHELEDTRSHLSSTARLRRATELGRFVLHYQPIVELESGRVAAAEALIRWPDGDRLVPPIEFIPVAERLGLIAAISDWVVGEVCRQSGEWRRGGIRLPLSFNIPIGLWRRETADRIAAVAAQHGVDPADLIVEITESALLTEAAGEAGLRRLEQSGVRVAIDDFGTGYSSLARLRELPVDALKIDRSFVAAAVDDPAAAAIVRSIVQLAGSIELDTIAEGIETDAQRRLLHECGCRLGQGFHFARPLPAAELPARL